jgi:asparagine synthase (glutamine-hydrolysing)
MCGIAGFIADPRHQSSSNALADIAAAMDGSLQHRGPDGHGVWIDNDVGVTLVHTRLAIVDLSIAGHQPMHSSDGRFVISYNGEVYNHTAIREEIAAKGHKFRGSSDTEVILESIARYGVAATVKRLIGMFAFAVWDKRDRVLTLVRDRLGIKPLYWGKFDGLFIFGSELKALHKHPGWTPQIKPEAVASFIRHAYVPAPHTIYQGVYKLEPGTILSLSWQAEPKFEKFWDAREVAIEGIGNRFSEDDASLTARLEALLTDAVRLRMMADVPVGAFLSGGIDSSTIVALMKIAGLGPVKTFSIGFELAPFNEAPHAAAVARYLHTEHTELMVTSREALDVVPRLAEMFDEPFADSSQIPTFLVSAMTRKHVSVALTGDGGDELFGGYNRYQLANRSLRLFSVMPEPLRNAVAKAITSLTAERWDQLLAILPRKMAPQHIGEKLYKAASALRLNNPYELYRRLVTHWEPSDLMKIDKLEELQTILWDNSVADDFPNLLDRMQFLDLVTYLPDDVLAKVDRSSMAVGLEARVPLLDHRVVDFAWRLPHSAKIRGGTTKWLLRQVLYRHVPKELVERPKMGFGVPIGNWLRGPLRDWADDLLSEKRLEETGFFDAARVRTYWDEHLSGRHNWQYLLWDLLMFESWRERWG